jgi:hypothetical protein
MHHWATRGFAMAFFKAIARLLFRSPSTEQPPASSEGKKQDGVTILG